MPFETMDFYRWHYLVLILEAEGFDSSLCGALWEIWLKQLLHERTPYVGLRPLAKTLQDGSVQVTMDSLAVQYQQHQSRSGTWL